MGGRNYPQMVGLLIIIGFTHIIHAEGIIDDIDDISHPARGWLAGWT
jgi:hypothetical protein